MTNTLLSIAIVAGVLLCLLPICGDASINEMAIQWSPIDIAVNNPSYSGNPFDLIATATFVHGASSETRTSQLFYAGGNTWKLRFTGTRPGTWTFTTSSADSQLNGLNGTITVSPAAESDYGFVAHQGNRWARQKGPDGMLEAIVPQFVMYSNPSQYHNNPSKIDADIQTFLVQHGFNGFHTNVFCRWFDIDKERSDQHGSDPNPDFRTFEALELLISKVHAVGGLVHIWKWGDEQRKLTPVKWGINGTVDRRLQRYVAARLGPLPGWTMGYGFDLFEWVNTSQLCSWHSYMQDHFGWNIYLGGRSHTNQLNQICETLDYSSYEQHKPDYAKYVETIEARPHKPSFSEDRFRIRDPSPYPLKDYTELETRRGLYHSTMAGGVANTWGNLVGSDGQMSMPYPNPHWSRTYADFFQNRFILGMVRDNALTNGVCLRTSDSTRFIFYRENTNSISMNLSGMPFSQSGVAVDSTQPYLPISLGTLSPGSHTWTAPHTSDWVIAVETADTQSPSTPTNVSATTQSHSSISISWTASTDNIGVLGYKVFRNETMVGTSSLTFYLDTGLQPSTTYSYRISAYDSSGNESAQSTPAAVATTEAMPDFCSIDLGTVNVINMLTHPQNSDGDTTATTVDGLDCRRPINTGDQYFYFAIDDGFMYNEPGTTRYLEVCYFDDQTSSVYMQPQYDAVGDGTGNIYRAGSNVNFSNSGKWRTATWTLTDCKFANRQNAGADFRIYTGPYDVKIDSVRVSKIPWSNYNSVQRELGSNEVYKGLSHPQPSDGTTTPTTIGGRECRKPTGSSSYFYFNVSDAIIYNGNPSTVYLKVEYYDSPGGMILPQYDSMSGIYTDATTLNFTGINTWKEAYWTLTNARFANNQNGSADFRLSVGSGQNVHIGKVVVSKVPFSDDTTPPSVPTNVSATTQSATSILVTWTASTDNVGVTGYRIFRNGSEAGTSGTASYLDTGLTPGTTYSYTVSAYDAAGNSSGLSSPPAVATTESIVDNEPPSVPTGVTATAQSSTAIQVTWTASTDNVGVTGYKIFRNGNLAGTSGTTVYNDTGLAPGTTYSYTVSAYDAAGNESAQSSPPATATTTQPATGMQWLWEADNHTVVGSLNYESLWTDGVAKFIRSSHGGNWDIQWTSPGTPRFGVTSGVATVVNPDGSSGRYTMITHFDGRYGAGSNGNDSNSATYWDLYKGVTVSWKVYIEQIDPDASGHGNVYFGINNNSSSGLISGTGIGLWWGWDINVGDIRFNCFNSDRTPMGSWIGISENVIGNWSIWTLSAQRVANAVYWDVWINGVHQGANPSYGGHTFRQGGSGYDWTRQNCADTHVRFGQARPQPFLHKSHWDRLGVTNAGAVPGWDGIAPVADNQPPSVPANVQATVQTPKQVKITWNASTDNVGVTGYRIFRNGVEIATSATTSYTDTGVTPATSYSYTVSAYDEAGNNSGQSSPAAIAATMSAVDVASAKQLANGANVGMVSQIVTAVFDDFIYIEAADRYAGIRVKPASMPTGLAVGVTVDVGGTLQTVNGERQIGNATVVITGTGSVEPLGMNNSTVGGGD